MHLLLEASFSCGKVTAISNPDSRVDPDLILVHVEIILVIELP